MRLYRCAVFAVAVLFVLPLHAQQVGWLTTRSNKVYRWEGEGIPKAVPGNLKQVSLGGDGDVWGISPSGDVYRWSGSQWQQMPGSLNQISVGNARDVWGITPANDLVHWNGTSWDQPIPSKLIFISVGVDGTKVGINPDGDVYRRSASTWDLLSGQKLTRVSVADSQRILGINGAGETFRWVQSRWEKISGKPDALPSGQTWSGTRDAMETQIGTLWSVLENGYWNWSRREPNGTWSSGVIGQVLVQDQEFVNQISVRDPVTGSPTPPGAQLTPEQQQVLDAHNNERQRLRIPPLIWSPGLVQYAQQRADLLARNNDTSLTHPLDRGASSNSFKPGEPIGENLHYSSNWSSSGPGTIAPLSEAVLGAKGRPGLNDIEGWLDEKPWYHYDNNTCDPGRNCGHYTQMVWKATQLVGCAKQTTSVNGWLYTYIACEYYPAGNTGGKPY